MNSSPEEFDRLKNLLALKRHEQPPPGFFNHFSDKVIARIETGGPAARRSLRQRLFPELDAKPVLACAYGLVITGLLVVGLGVSESLEPDAANTAPNLGSPWFAAQTPAPLPAAPVTTTVPHPLAEQTDTTSSVIPVFTSSTSHSPFDLRPFKVEQVSYTHH